MACVIILLKEMKMTDKYADRVELLSSLSNVCSNVIVTMVTSLSNNLYVKKMIKSEEMSHPVCI